MPRKRKRKMPLDRHGLPTPLGVAAALRSGAIADEWLAATMPQVKSRIVAGWGMLAPTAEQRAALTDAYVYAVRHGWATWERSHGHVPTRPTRKQLTIDVTPMMVGALLDFRVFGFTESTLPQPPKYWRDRLGKIDWPARTNFAAQYIVAFRHGWWLRQRYEDTPPWE